MTFIQKHGNIPKGNGALHWMKLKENNYHTY